MSQNIDALIPTLFRSLAFAISLDSARVETAPRVRDRNRSDLTAMCSHVHGRFVRGDAHQRTRLNSQPPHAAVDKWTALKTSTFHAAGVRLGAISALAARRPACDLPV